LVVVERPGQEAQRVFDALPDILTKLGAGVLLRGLARQLGELTHTPVTTRKTEKYEAGRQKAAVAEVINRGDQLLARQVTGDAEHDERARARNSRQPAISRVTKRVARPFFTCHPAAASRSCRR